MTKQEQVKEILEVIKHCGDYTGRDCAECDYRLYGHCNNQKQCEAEALYNEGYRKIDEFEKCRKCPAWSGTDCTRNPYTEGCLDDKVNLKNEIKRLEKENEQLKAKLEKNPLAIKQKIMEEDDYELTEREQATLFLDRMESDVEILHDIVENLDELLGKGIDEYIKGIDGVEGLKDMWERSAVREFAEKVKSKLFAIFGKTMCSDLDTEDITDIIDELLKEYE